MTSIRPAATITAIVALFISGVACTGPVGTARPRAAVDVGAAQPLVERVNDEAITAAAASPDGKFLLGTARGRVYFPRLGLGETDARATSVAEMAGKVTTVAVAADGEGIAASSLNGQILFGRASGQLYEARFDAAALAFDPGSATVAFAGFGVVVFDVVTGRLVGEYEQPMREGGRDQYRSVRLTDDDVIAAAVDGAVPGPPGRRRRPARPSTAVVRRPASRSALTGPGRRSGPRTGTLPSSILAPGPSSWTRP